MGTTLWCNRSDLRYGDDNLHFMSRPGLAALISAVVASIAAFLVLKGWGLIGTLTGATLFPIVHTLVSHFSNRGIDQTMAALRKRSGKAETAAGERGQSPADPVRADNVAADSVAIPAVADPPSRRSPLPAWTRWLPVGLACLALAVGVYSVFLSPPAERVVVRERVIEREVASAAQLTTVSNEAATSGRETDAATSTVTSTTTSTTEQNAPGAGSSSTTLESPTDTVDPDGSADAPPSEDPGAGNVSSSSTSIVGNSTPTTVPPAQTAP